jgi:polyisoprenoid-binding protein YceI
VTAVAATGAAVGHYVLDKGASRFTVRAFAGGMLSAMGHNPTMAIRNFTGEVTFDAADPEKGTLHMQVRADSLQVTDDIKSKDRTEMESTMKQHVLQSAKYPNITFDAAVASAIQLSEGRYYVTLNGTLSLRGATGLAPVRVQVSLLGDMLRASGDFSILQTDYDIPLVSVAGGALKLKDELKFSFDIVARKQE